MNLINEIKRIRFEGALLPALCFEKDIFLKNKNTKFWKKNYSYMPGLTTLRVGRTVTKLTVHWELYSRV